MQKRQKVLVIVGPTSSGKSALAVLLARRFGGEVISADSRQVYKGLNIGTGKITKLEMKGVRHHLLGIANPKKGFTAHDFLVYGQRAIDDIALRGRLPIIAGGTGFYVDALVGRIALSNVPVNLKLRTQLEKKTTVQLLAILKKRDHRRAKTVEPHNKRRLIRAIEIAYAIGKTPMIDLRGQSFDVLWIGLDVSLPILEKKIASRLGVRMRQGMVAEAKRLHAKGLSYKRMEALGLEYRFLARLLQKKISKREFEEELFRDIRRYAKRQMTYWKRNKEIRWFDPLQKPKIFKTVRDWISGPTRIRT